MPPVEPYLQSELLALTVSERSHPRIDDDALNSGTHLLFAIANRWLSTLTYVFPTGPEEGVSEGEVIPDADDSNEPFEADDLPIIWFADDRPESRQLQLKCYSKGFFLESHPQPVSVEPPIPFDAIRGDRYVAYGFTHILLARSKSYTPSTADPLVAIIAEYFVAI